MTYSFETKQDRWSELADHYTSVLDELAELDTEDVFVQVDEFDVDEVL